jgi:2-dehydropantoate 2-reductase
MRSADALRKRANQDAAAAAAAAAVGGADSSEIAASSSTAGLVGPTLTVARNGGDTVTTSGYEIDVSRASKMLSLREAIGAGTLRAINVGGPIDSLIVCTKAPATALALADLRTRLRPSSVITLLQNGMGVYDELCEKYWPEPATRPQFVLATTTHGVSPVQPGKVLHVTRPGEGALKFGVVPDPRGTDIEQWLWGGEVGNLPMLTPPDSPRNPLPPPPAGAGLDNLHATLGALLSLAPLVPTLLPMPHLYHELLLKLAVNASINPLTAVLGGGYLSNGTLVRGTPGRRLIKQTATETSRILTAYLASLAGGTPEPDTARLFAPDVLTKRITTVATETRDNTSSMALDVKNGRMSEIDYINGYLVALGDRLGVPTPVHRALVEMVKFKAQVAGLGDRIYPAVRDHVRANENEALEIRKLALDERRVALQERELLIRETRTTEAKLAQRALKREVRRRERNEKMLAAEKRKAEAVVAGAAQLSAPSAVESTGSASDSDATNSTASGTHTPSPSTTTETKP